MVATSAVVESHRLFAGCNCRSTEAKVEAVEAQTGYKWTGEAEVGCQLARRSEDKIRWAVFGMEPRQERYKWERRGTAVGNRFAEYNWGPGNPAIESVTSVRSRINPERNS